MNTGDAKIIAQFLLAGMTNEMPATIRVIEAVPADRLNYQPDKTSRTALGLVRHITLEDEWLLTGVANGNFATPPDDSDACGILTPKDAVARYKKTIPAAIEQVRGVSGENLVRTLDMLGAIQMPAINFLDLAVKHSVHHRGQLSSYLRAMGGKVPGIYGPSADTPKE